MLPSELPPRPLATYVRSIQDLAARLTEASRVVTDALTADEVFAIRYTISECRRRGGRRRFGMMPSSPPYLTIRSGGAGSSRQIPVSFRQRPLRWLRCMPG